MLWQKLKEVWRLIKPRPTHDWEEDWEEAYDRYYEENPLCPHGVKYDECDDCFRESDFLFDCYREDRLF